MSHVVWLIGVLFVQVVLAVVVKTAASVPLVKNFEPQHRHLGAERVRRFAALTAPLTLAATAVVGVLAHFDAFLAPGWRGFAAVVAAVVALVGAGTIPFARAFRLEVGLALTVGFLAELFVALLTLAVGLLIQMTGPIGLVLTVAGAAGVAWVRERNAERTKEVLFAEAGRPVAPSLPPPAPAHAAAAPA